MKIIIKHNKKDNVLIITSENIESRFQVSIGFKLKIFKSAATFIKLNINSGTPLSRFLIFSFHNTHKIYYSPGKEENVIGNRFLFEMEDVIFYYPFNDLMTAIGVAIKNEKQIKKNNKRKINHANNQGLYENKSRRLDFWSKLHYDDNKKEITNEIPANNFIDYNYFINDT